MTTPQRKLEKKIRKDFWTAVNEYHLIEEGDKIMVCLSGGKDSYFMLDMIRHAHQVMDINFEFIAVNLDQKQPGFPEDVLPTYLDKIGVPYQIVNKDTYSVVTKIIPEGKTMCSLCSRLRRGILYSTAAELGCNKLALGHHRDDIIETFFLNLYYAGRLETMPPKYRTNDGKFEVIRPLAFCKEKDIIAYAEHENYPIIPCTLCGSQEGLQRQVIKEMLNKWDEQMPNRTTNIFKALTNIFPSHLLDKNLFDFEKLVPKLFEEPATKPHTKKDSSLPEILAE